tara:strand:- start:594 stop:1400 length:807 start_codon:yes stop_codon:yes gene_type:complete
MQKYYFLTGLSRAGNTLFASIMNQNKNIAVTGNSIMPDLMWRIDSVKNEEEYINFPNEKSIDSIIDNILPNYYGSWSQEYIIDRSTWGLLDFFKLLKKHIKNEIKIIILVRDVVEVLASFVKFSNENPNFFLNKVGKNAEEKCDFLMRYNEKTGVGQIYGQLSSIKNLIQKENRKYIHIVEYNDLINNTEKTIDSVYNFLNIPKFGHKFTNLSQLKVGNNMYNDDVLGGKLHTIRTNKIKKNEYNVNDVLPQTVINKYSGLNIWRNET